MSEVYRGTLPGNFNDHLGDGSGWTKAQGNETIIFNIMQLTLNNVRHCSEKTMILCTSNAVLETKLTNTVTAPRNYPDNLCHIIYEPTL